MDDAEWQEAERKLDREWYNMGEGTYNFTNTDFCNREDEEITRKVIISFTYHTIISLE